MDDDPRIDNTPQTPTDEGLRCPECEYNLTGLEVEVCPECGVGFDRKQLLGNTPAPIPIWGRRTRIGTLRAFVQMLLEIWLHPIRFAKRFPENPDQHEALIFSRYCLGVAIVIAVPPYLLCATSSSSSLLMAVVSCVGVVLGVYLCEWFSAGALFVPFDESIDIDSPFPQDLAMVRMTRAYLLLSALYVCGKSLVNLFLGRSFSSDWLASWGVWTIVSYWWICMACIAKTRRDSLANLYLSLAMLPVCVAASVFVAGTLGTIFFFAFM